jgi:hypothetical protein
MVFDVMVISGRSKVGKMMPNVRSKNYTRKVGQLNVYSWASLHVKFAIYTREVFRTKKSLKIRGTFKCVFYVWEGAFTRC